MNTLERALGWYRRGDLAKAEAACAAALADSNHRDNALALLAEIHLSAGRPASAIPVLRQIARWQPRDAAVRRRLAGALLSVAQPGEAALVLREAIALEPASPRAHNNLGQALMQLGEFPAAIASFALALEHDPNYAIGRNNLGLAWEALGELARAEACFRRALALDANLAVAPFNLALLLQKRGQLLEALANFDAALARSPQQFEFLVGRGAVLAQLNRPAEALQCFDGALRVKSGDAPTLARKASALLAMEHSAEALGCADEALKIEPDLADAHNVRAGALRQLHRLSQALSCLERALALDPNHLDAWCNRGVVAHEMGDTELAALSYRRALALDPRCVRARTRLLSALIPPVPMTEEESVRARAAFDAELEPLAQWLESASLGEADAFSAAGQQLFYLSYREESNKVRLQHYRRASAQQLARFSPAATPAPAIGSSPFGSASRRFKLGFVSAHVFDHSVFNALLKGWLKTLDRTRFDLTLFSVGTRQDAVTRAALESADQFHAGARSLPEWTRLIREGGFDALVYPEIGMDEVTLGLAHLRLAPRQFAAWGHPETSGLPTIDYYLSAEAFEPPHAQEHYSERLIALPHLGVYAERLGAPAAAVDLNALGLSRQGPVLICPGVPFKYQPQDDHVLVEIAQRLGSCHFIFFTHDRVELSNRLHARIAAAFQQSGLDPSRYLHTLPWLSQSSFLGLLRTADVYLDTIGFSGFNTLMHAVEAGLPCATYDGRFMRGRLGSGIMRQLRSPELIAATKAQYVDTAVRLASDGAYRNELRERMRSSEHLLYGDRAAVDALSAVLIES
jgi:predicted O-linked N-acetylglucosamine transferase (SPINDLY family)